MKGKRLEYSKTHEVKNPMRLGEKAYRSYEFEPAPITVKELGISGWLRVPSKTRKASVKIPEMTRNLEEPRYCRGLVCPRRDRIATNGEVVAARLFRMIANCSGILAVEPPVVLGACNFSGFPRYTILSAATCRLNS